MRSSTFSVLSSLLAVVSATTGVPSEWSHGFNKSTHLSFSFMSETVKEGTLLPLSSVSQPPKLSIKGLSTEIHSIVIVMVDPDSAAAVAPTVHWLESGWHPLDEVTHSGALASRTPKPELPYSGPSPPPGAAPNRYVILAFQEGPKGTILLDVPASEPKSARAKFDVEKWRKTNNLPPAFAGTYFLAQNEDQPPKKGGYYAKKQY